MAASETTEKLNIGGSFGLIHFVSFPDGFGSLTAGVERGARRNFFACSAMEAFDTSEGQDR